MRTLLDLHASIGGASREWWVAGSDLAVEGTWLWLSGLIINNQFFFMNEYLPSGDEYNCMLLSYTLSFYAMAQRCTDAWYPVCQYS